MRFTLFPRVQVTGFEPAASRPQTEHSDQTELHLDSHIVPSVSRTLVAWWGWHPTCFLYEILNVHTFDRSAPFKAPRRGVRLTYQDPAGLYTPEFQRVSPWHGRRESNPQLRFWRPSCCRCIARLREKAGIPRDSGLSSSYL